MDDESAEGMDIPPGSDIGEQAGDEHMHRRTLLDLAREADALKGERDQKLQQAIKHIASLVTEGFKPIVFCRFVQTAEYVAATLRERLPKGTEVIAVTGMLPHDEREARVLQLAEAPRRVLVATDCLSEGINLQEYFDAVLHYDLSWNPTRHEQREGRVDRFGQPNGHVRVITYYGTDNPVDGIVLNVLLRKHRTIRSSLGISVPLPADADQVVEAIFEGLLLRGATGDAPEMQQVLPGFEDVLIPQREELFRTWEVAAEREKRSRTMFAQETIKVEEVAQELQAVRAAIGSEMDVSEFTRMALAAHNAVVSGNGVVRIDLRDAPKALREAVGMAGTQDGAVLRARFSLPVQDGEIYLSRTHPFVAGLAGYIMDTALDMLDEGVARRCGVIRTRSVTRRTTRLLVRFRYHIIITRHGYTEQPLLAEDCHVLTFAGSPQQAEWLDDEASETLLHARADANIAPDQAQHFLRLVIDGFEAIRPYLDGVARQRGQMLLEAHTRVRTAARMTGVRYRIEPQLPPDVLGIYVYLPAASAQ
jgi:hypothetical protein